MEAALSRPGSAAPTELRGKKKIKFGVGLGRKQGAEEITTDNADFTEPCRSVCRRVWVGTGLALRIVVGRWAKGREGGTVDSAAEKKGAKNSVRDRAEGASRDQDQDQDQDQEPDGNGTSVDERPKIAPASC